MAQNASLGFDILQQVSCSMFTFRCPSNVHSQFMQDIREGNSAITFSKFVYFVNNEKQAKDLSLSPNFKCFNVLIGVWLQFPFSCVSFSHVLQLVVEDFFHTTDENLYNLFNHNTVKNIAYCWKLKREFQNGCHFHFHVFVFRKFYDAT